jgi:hypothetical protein
MSSATVIRNDHAELLFNFAIDLCLVIVIVVVRQYTGDLAKAEMWMLLVGFVGIPVECQVILDYFDHFGPFVGNAWRGFRSKLDLRVSYSSHRISPEIVMLFFYNL